MRTTGVADETLFTFVNARVSGELGQGYQSLAALQCPASPFLSKAERFVSSIDSNFGNVLAMRQHADVADTYYYLPSVQGGGAEMRNFQIKNAGNVGGSVGLCGAG